MRAESAEALKIFYSYAPQDKELRDQLDKHLAALKWSGKIETWCDRQIHPGLDWAYEIDMRLNSADIVLLLVSPDFIASKYCWGIETGRALEINRNGDNRVIPIYLRPVDLKDTPINTLQRLPVGPNPITKWRNRDEGFKEVVEGIRGVIEDLLDQRVKKEASKKIEEKTREVLKELDQLTYKHQTIKTPPILEGVPFMSLDLASITNFFFLSRRFKGIRVIA
jgi:TIR domain